jgi:hypothetical protein
MTVVCVVDNRGEAGTFSVKFDDPNELLPASQDTAVTVGGGQRAEISFQIRVPDSASPFDTVVLGATVQSDGGAAQQNSSTLKIHVVAP